ncbi:Ref family recombination enhancement nuclease [Dyella sp. AtDHG13]|uniref:HNH endonuclease signature motif containing protein n=1 Tax=Dyella sp. AtDHG13 TaxID=1938897 RepID=UPI0021010994|nr:Ref family recombination enhancement nuclease [Dyella sp. AtDHG13]
MSTAAEKRHMDRVARLPCACCGCYGVQVHHIRETMGMGQRASNWLVIPLCPSCHTGPKGIHGDRSMLKIIKADELSLLADTMRLLAIGAA